MMYGMQGMNYGGEQGGFPGGPAQNMMPSGINPSPFTYSGPHDNGTGGGGPTGRDRPNPDNFDHTMPNDPRNAPPYNPYDPYNMRGRPVKP